MASIAGSSITPSTSILAGTMLHPPLTPPAMQQDIPSRGGCTMQCLAALPADGNAVLH